MSQLSRHQVQTLDAVADEAREIVASRGHSVEVAARADRAFDCGKHKSMSMRCLVEDAVRAAASHKGVQHADVRGGLEVRLLEGLVDSRLRLRRATRDSRGDLRVKVNSDSALLHGDVDEETLLREEQALLLWTRSAEGFIEEILAAEIVGFDPGKPGFFRLGQVVALGSSDRFDPPGSFVPSEEDLGLDDDEEDEDDTGDHAIGGVEA